MEQAKKHVLEHGTGKTHLFLVQSESDLSESESDLSEGKVRDIWPQEFRNLIWLYNHLS